MAAWPMRQATVDLLIGVVLLALALFLLWESTDPRYAVRVPGHAFGPMFYPRLILGIWVVIAVVIMLRGALLMSSDDSVQALQWGQLASVVVVTGVYMWVVTLLGFVLSSALFMFVVLMLLGFRRPIIVGALSIGFPLAAWFVFQFLLRIPLPTSPWSGQI
jgi:putative tricarboxylic transport membrane protein